MVRGQGGGPPDRGDDPGHPGGVAQQGAAGAAADHLAHRAAAVQVDQVGDRLDLPGRFRQALRVVAEQLHPERPFRGDAAQQVTGGGAAEVQAVGADHFGEDQGGAEPLHDQAVGEVGDPRHRGEDDGIGQLQGADFHEKVLIFAYFLCILAWRKCRGNSHFDAAADAEKLPIAVNLIATGGDQTSRYLGVAGLATGAGILYTVYRFQLDRWVRDC